MLSGPGLFLGQLVEFEGCAPTMGCLGGPGQCGRRRTGAYVEFTREGATRVVPRWSQFISGVWSLR